MRSIRPARTWRRTVMIALAGMIAGVGVLQADTSRTNANVNRSDQLVVQSIEGCRGEMVSVIVTVDNQSQQLDAMGFHLVYDHKALSYRSCKAGSLTGDWPFFGCNENELGDVIVGGFTLSPIEPGVAGSLAVLEFEVVCDDCENGDQSPLQAARLVDDIATFEVINGVAVYQCPGSASLDAEDD